MRLGRRGMGHNRNRSALEGATMHVPPAESMHCPSAAAGLGSWQHVELGKLRAVQAWTSLRSSPERRCPQWLAQWAPSAAC